MHNTHSHSESFGTNEPHPELYATDTIEKIIDSHLPQFCSRPIIFSGFASVASKFGSRCDVTYVDSSGDTASENYQNIRKVVKGDVLDYIYFNASSCLVISCKTSANWHHAFQLDKLTTAIERNRYQLVVLDFFDTESIRVKNRFKAKEFDTQIEWDLDKVTDKNPSCGHSIADVKGHHPESETDGKPVAKLSMYDKKALVNYLKRRLPKHEICIHSSVIPQDLNFTITIKQK